VLNFESNTCNINNNISEFSFTSKEGLKLNNTNLKSYSNLNSALFNKDTEKGELGIEISFEESDKKSFSNENDFIPLIFDVPFRLISKQDLNYCTLSLNLNKLNSVINNLNNSKSSDSKNLNKLGNIEDKDIKYFLCNTQTSTVVNNNLDFKEKEILKFYINKTYLFKEAFHRVRGNLIYDKRIRLNTPVGISVNNTFFHKMFNSNSSSLNARQLNSGFLSLINENTINNLLQLESFLTVDSLSEVLCIK
jgi:hypothetical protein